MEDVYLDSLMQSSKHFDQLSDASNDLGIWVEVMKTINFDEDSDITFEKFKKPNKDVLVKHLFDAFQGIV